jgi:hypothetical protein
MLFASGCGSQAGKRLVEDECKDVQALQQFVTSALSPQAAM